MTHSRFHIAILVIFTALATAGRGDDLDVPTDKIADGEPGEMVHRYLMHQVQDAVRQWTAEYEKLKTPEQVAAYQKRVRQKCLAAIGGLPERTPLAPRIHSGGHEEEEEGECVPARRTRFSAAVSGRHRAMRPLFCLQRGTEYQSIGTLLT